MGHRKNQKEQNRICSTFLQSFLALVAFDSDMSIDKEGKTRDLVHTQ